MRGPASPHLITPLHFRKEVRRVIACAASLPHQRWDLRDRRCPGRLGPAGKSRSSPPPPVTRTRKMCAGGPSPAACPGWWGPPPPPTWRLPSASLKGEGQPRCESSRANEPPPKGTGPSRPPRAVPRKRERRRGGPRKPAHFRAQVRLPTPAMGGAHPPDPARPRSSLEDQGTWCWVLVLGAWRLVRGVGFLVRNGSEEH